jgi:hypothetical protein
MNDHGFFDMVPGTIGTISYKKNMMKNLPDDVKQQYVSKSANERMRALIGNGIDPVTAYTKARQDSWSELEVGNSGMNVKNVSVQIGQEESYDVIVRIESLDDFGGWLNPSLVDMIKEQFKNNAKHDKQ